eukprot:gene11990-14166_t
MFNFLSLSWSGDLSGLIHAKAAREQANKAAKALKDQESKKAAQNEIDQWEAAKVKVAEETKAKEDAFKELLREQEKKKKLTVSTKWTTTKLAIIRDPRFRAVSHKAEQFFKEYIKYLSDSIEEEKAKALQAAAMARALAEQEKVKEKSRSPSPEGSPSPKQQKEGDARSAPQSEVPVADDAPVTEEREELKRTAPSDRHEDEEHNRGR